MREHKEGTMLIGSYDYIPLLSHYHILYAFININIMFEKCADCLQKLLKRGLFEKTFFPLRITLFSGVFSAFCLYDGLSLQRLRLVSEAFARDGDSS